MHKNKHGHEKGCAKRSVWVKEIINTFINSSKNKKKPFREEFISTHFPKNSIVFRTEVNNISSLQKEEKGRKQRGT